MILRKNKESKVYLGDAINAACDGLRRKNYVATPTLPFDQTEIKSFWHENQDFGDNGFISSFHELERLINEVKNNPSDYGVECFLKKETSYGSF